MLATGTTLPCAGGWRGMVTRGSFPATSPVLLCFEVGCAGWGSPSPNPPLVVTSLSPPAFPWACLQTVRTGLSSPAAAGTAATGMGSPWAGGGCVVVVVPAAGPTGCSLLRHRPTAWPWACHPEPEGERGPTHVGAGGSVPVPAASLDGARRTGCERRRPAGVRCRMVPGWPGYQGTGAGPVALPVLPVQSRLLLWSWLVMGREML